MSEAIHDDDLTHEEEVVARVTTSSRIKCPWCSEHRKKSHEKTMGVTVKPEGNVYQCFHCHIEEDMSGIVPRRKIDKLLGYESPRPPRTKHKEIQNVQPISINLATNNQDYTNQYLASRGIDINTIPGYGVVSGVKYFHGVGEQWAIGFLYGKPTQPNAIKWRCMNHKAFTQDGSAQTFYGLDQLPADTKQLVICEGELDALTLASVGIPAVSCPNGAPVKVSKDKRIDPEEEGKFNYVWESKSLIDQCEKIVLAVDNDSAGEALKEELVRRIGRGKCWQVEWPEDAKDSNEVLLKHGAEFLREVIDGAVQLPLEGVYTATSYSNSIEEIYNSGMGRGASTGLNEIDQLFTVAPGLHIVTGVPGSGKSEFIDQLMVNLAQNDHWKFAVCSFENPVHLHIAKLSEKVIGKPFFQGHQTRMNETERNTATDFIDKHFVFLDSNSDEAESSIESILERTKQAIMRLGVRGLLIDPYNYIDNKGSTDEHLSISAMLTKLSKFGKAHDLAIFFVAHPAKMYAQGDGSFPVPTGMHISGSAAWFAKADVGFTVHRGQQGVEIHCWKVRFKWIGQTGMRVIDYELATGRYSDPQIPYGAFSVGAHAGPANVPAQGPGSTPLSQTLVAPQHILDQIEELDYDDIPNF